MTTQIQTNSDGRFIRADEFFALLRTNLEFSDWLCRRIHEFDMKFNQDIYIFLDLESAKELSKIETFQDRSAHKRFNSILK
jgi:phage anti-repressor protein